QPADVDVDEQRRRDEGMKPRPRRSRPPRRISQPVTASASPESANVPKPRGSEELGRSAAREAGGVARSYAPCIPAPIAPASASKKPQRANDASVSRSRP